MTVLGGSLARPEVEAVMALAGQHFCSIPDLEVAAGNRIAQMLKLPDGYTALVTAGAAAAMQAGLAGILTGDNPKFIQQLPDLTGMKSEVIIQKTHRNGFDHQLRATGVKLVEIESVDDLRKAVNPQTAMLHFSNFANAAGQIKVDEWVKLGKELNIPTFIDAAADTPPVSHLVGLRQHGLRPLRLQWRKSHPWTAVCRPPDRKKRNRRQRAPKQQPARRHSWSLRESRQRRNYGHDQRS